MANPEVTEAKRVRPRGRYAADDLAPRRAAIVANATAVFLEFGFGGASFEAIARQANVSPKTIYAWFGGKAGLFDAVMERMGQAMLAGLAEALDPVVPAQVALTEFGRRLLAIALAPDSIALQRAVLAEAQRLPDIAATFYDTGPRRALDMLTVYLAAQSVAEPECRAEDFVSLIEGELLRRMLLGLERPSQHEKHESRIDRAVRAVLGT